MNMPDQIVIAFPLYVALLGGAQSVRYGVRRCWITQGNGRTQWVPRRLMPDPAHVTAFTAADIAYKHGKELTT